MALKSSNGNDVASSSYGTNGQEWVKKHKMRKLYGWYHVSFPYGNMSKEARIWLKIVCACLVPEKHVTHVTRERVCLVFALMIERPVNVGGDNQGNFKETRDERGDGGVATTSKYGLPIEKISRALCRVGLGFEEPFDDDYATDEEKA
ncbi:hypothetical protein HAX54_006614 [Datura stramonium]|uniref:Uncharacterized protein n=1 Tax=Datura stramonium TaxID=4076 RepID=A0ABS8WXU4_DATST|nr:hypothetical protein [Datura stramonium]